jgi:predicted signal transduction protein with EAL and GGDEF domain
VLSERAYTNPLTGLAKLAMLSGGFQLAIERSRGSKTPSADAMIDLNAFKAINNCHGHAAGDHVLPIDLEQVRRALESLNRQLMKALSHRVVLPSGTEVSIGGSIGFAILPMKRCTNAKPQASCRYFEVRPVAY